MQPADLEALWKQKRVQTAKLREVSQLTIQMAQAADRNDETSVTLLLSMRAEPLRELTEMEDSLRASLLLLPEEEAIRGRELLDGSPAADAAEEELCQQVGQYRRLLESTLELDRRISLSIGGQRSFYHTFRE